MSVTALERRAETEARLARAVEGGDPPADDIDACLVATKHALNRARLLDRWWGTEITELHLECLELHYEALQNVRRSISR